MGRLYGYCFIALWSCCIGPLGAQSPSKLNATLYQHWLETPVVHRVDVVLPVLVQGDLKTLRPLIEELGGTYRYEAGDIAAVALPLSGLEPLLSASALRRIEYRTAPLHELSNHPDDSLMLQHNRVSPVHQGNTPLPRPLQGTGVLLGMIDDGIEWQHPDFINADGTTRLQGIWDQKALIPTYRPTLYGYGAAWTKPQIDNGQCLHRPGDHGSHVMGTAAGNAHANGKYLGIAPKTDLACVAIDLENYFLGGFVDGVHYLFEFARQRNQPCVINSSVGSYGSGHDGKDLYAQMVTQLIEARSGQALVQAAGNARQFDFHVGVDQEQDTVWVPFKYHHQTHQTHFTLYGDTADLAQLRFSLALLSNGSAQPTARTRTFQLQHLMPTMGGLSHTSELLFYDAQGEAVTLELYLDQYTDAYALEVQVRSVSNIGVWRLETIGTGRYDIWSHPSLLRTSEILSYSGGYYQAPDNQQSIVGYWTCADPVVVVGAYQNRTYIVNYTQDTFDVSTAGYPVPGIAAFSSVGPTRTGLLKPDLNAPGGQVMSATTLSNLRFQRTLSSSNRLDAGGWHWLNRGTSMSAPMVAGALALFLECQPQATARQLLGALHRSTRLDAAVLSPQATLPNVHWGYGKLDVAALAERCVVRGCMDSTALNYNPVANVADSTACRYAVGVEQVSSTTGSLVVVPNPAQEQTRLDYQLATSSTATLSIYNALGQLVYKHSLIQQRGSLSLEVSRWLPGWYVVVLQETEGQGQQQPLLVLPVTP